MYMEDIVAAAVDKRGLKRICPNCGTRYYDFNKRPATCPECQTAFTAEVKAKGRGRRSAIANDDVVVRKGAAAVAETNDEEILEDDTLISLDEAEQMEDSDDEAEDLASDDIDIGEDLDDDFDDDLDDEIEDLEEEE